MDTVHKIMLVDDHTLFRDGMRRLLDNRPDCKVVAEASNGAEFLQTVRTTPDIADVVFMDIDMPVIGGIEASQKALEINPELKIITLSMHGDQEYYFKMVSVGVKGFLLKSSDFDEVLSAIDTVSGGGSYFSQELLCSLVRELKPSSEPRSEEQLSQRETEVLLLICQGLSNQEIAERLFISKRTVDKHRANILDKTGCRNTANLVVYAIKNSLIEI